MKLLYEDLFAHNHHANHQLILSASAINTPPQVRSLISHILIAHQIWLARITDPGAPLTHQPWDLVATTDYNYWNNTLLRSTLTLLESEHTSFPTVIKYINTKGESYKNTIAEICSHIIAHSTYHRGQAALLLRQHDIEPPVTDYIFYKRLRL